MALVKKIFISLAISWLASVSQAYTLQDALHARLRANAWLLNINNSRPDKLSIEKFSIPFPMSSPLVFNEQIISEKFNSLASSMPASMEKVIFSDDPLPADIPENVSENLFLYIISKLEGIGYQAQGWGWCVSAGLDSMVLPRSEDIRPYYWLSRIENLEVTLKNFSELSPQEQRRISDLLIGLCLSNDNTHTILCTGSVSLAIDENTLFDYYKTYEAVLKKKWNDSFKVVLLDSPMSMKWEDATKTKLLIPYRKIDDMNLLTEALKAIKERWNLYSDFSIEFYRDDNDPRSLFIDAQYDYIATDVDNYHILWDPKRSIFDESIRHTIAHEFGHSLGFPDCYQNFYDRELQAIVHHQYDISNIMCSRFGKAQRLHIEALRETVKY